MESGGSEGSDFILIIITVTKWIGSDTWHKQAQYYELRGR